MKWDNLLLMIVEIIPFLGGKEMKTYYVHKITSLVLSLIMLFSFLNYFPTTTSVNATKATWITPGIYYIEFKNSGKVVDVTDESTQSGIQMQIWQKYDNHTNQKFKLEKDSYGWKITALNSNKVLSIKDYSLDDYAHITQYEEKSNPSYIKNQRWIIEECDEYVRLKNANSNKYMTVYCGDTSDGAKLIQRPAIASENNKNIKTEQQFQLVLLEGAVIKEAHWYKNFSENDFTWGYSGLPFSPEYINGNNWNNQLYNNISFSNYLKSYPNGDNHLGFWKYRKINGKQLYGISYLSPSMCGLLFEDSTLRNANKANSIFDYLVNFLMNHPNELYYGEANTVKEFVEGIMDICCSNEEDWNNMSQLWHRNTNKGLIIQKYVETEIEIFTADIMKLFNDNIKINLSYNSCLWDGYYQGDIWYGDLNQLPSGYGYGDGHWEYFFTNYSTKTQTAPLVVHISNNPNYFYTVNDKINQNPSNYVTSNLNYSNGIYEVSVNSSLNVRSGPGTGYSKIGSLSNGKQVEVIAVSSGNWGKINYNGKTGWICLQYAKYKEDSFNSNGSSGGTVSSWNTSSAGDYCVNVNSHLNVRSSASSKATLIGKLNNGDIVHVIETINNSDGSIWAHITYNGMNAYCCMKSSGGAYYLSQKIAPSKPSVNASGGNSFIDSTFSWNWCSNANSYDIRIYNSSGQLVDSKFGLTSTSYQTRLKAGNYQVDVASVYSSDSYTFSDRVSFSVSKVIPEKPTVTVCPGNDLSDTCISWNNCKYADCYDVVIYKSNGTQYKTISNTKDTSFKGNLSDIADYYVIITAKNNTDGTSASSDRKNFTVVSAVPSKPTLSLIAGNNHTNTTFTWNVCDNTNTYTLDVVNKDTGTSVLSKSLTGTNYEIILSTAGNYYAQVTAVYTKGGTINKSDKVDFFVENVDVTPFTVLISGVSDSMISLEWTESLHATQYDIYRYVDGSPKLIGTTSELSYTDTGLYLGTEYNYYVKSSNQWTEYTAKDVSSSTILLYLNGSGTQESPYLISSIEDWNEFADLINNKNTNKMFNSSCYKQTVDIDFSNYPFIPIGTKDTPFNGVFDGNYCKFTGVNINQTSDNIGMFGYCDNANIRNIVVHGTISSTNKQIGGIVGQMCCGGTIENCAFYGNISGSSNVGGIVGSIENGAKLIRCYHMGTVKGTNSGGIAGKISVGNSVNSTNSNISYCYHAGGNVSGTNSGGITGKEEIGTLKKCTIKYSDCFYLKNSASSATNGTTNSGILSASDTVFQNLAETLGEPYIDGGVTNNNYPVFVWESELYNFKGQGTASSPFLIETSADLVTMSEYVNDKYLNTKYGNSCYLQTSDIDLTNTDFKPIGNEAFPFKSKYNGGYHSITGLNITGDNSGLFGYVNNARIENLIVNGMVTSTANAGGLIGCSSEYVEIYQCAFNGSINSKSSGGLVGKVIESAKIIDCYHNGMINGTHAGGLIGIYENSNNTPSDSLMIASAYHGSGNISGGGAIGTVTGNTNAVSIDNVFYLKNSATTDGYARSVNETVLKELATTLEKPYSHGTIDNIYPMFEWQISKYQFEGNGTSENPYIIATADDLIALQNYINDPSYNKIYGSAYYYQTNDIDLGDREWEAIGINEQCPFNGIYDGNFCTIYGLNAYGDTYSGLFGQVGATSGGRNAGIYNLIIKYGTSCSASGVTGGTAAILMNGASVDCCSVIGDLSGGTGVGGIIGIVRKSATISNSYHNGNVSGHDRVSGIVGFVESGTARIENCYHTNGFIYADSNYGAIVGQSKGTSNIINCFYLNNSCDGAVNGGNSSGVMSVNSMVLQNLSVSLGSAYIDNFTNYNDGYPIFAKQFELDTPTVKGDANADGYFDISDAVMLQKWLLGSGELNCWQNVDLCEDKKIDVFDMVEIRKLLIEN